MSEKRSPVFVPIRCSFCAVHDCDVEKIIAGPAVFICDVCVGLCVDMLADGPAARWRRECGEAEYDSWGMTWAGD